MSKPLKIIHVGDLKDGYFNIPAYQRGYRWETKHIQALLKDILDFKNSSDPFYCLQPIVVVKNEVLSKTYNKTVYDVIDGQQRLTTLYLILHCTKQKLDYNIRYERLGSENASSDCNDQFLNYDKLLNITDQEKCAIADYFYLSQAIVDINAWLSEIGETINDPNAIIGQSIVPPEFRWGDYLVKDSDDPNKSLHDVRFIWYEADNTDVKASDNDITPIETFRRLNHGKTSLTAAELIKALLFQCDIYSEELRPLLKEIAFRRSTEWNNMELRLQDPFFWGMICPVEYNRPSHIDLVLSFVAQELIEKLPDGSIKTPVSDVDYDYQIIDTFLHMGLDNDKNGEMYKEKVEDIWNKIHDCYAVFLNWYEDRTLYHYIGLLVTLTSKRGEPHVKFLRTLKERFESSIRTEFIKYLKSEIAKEIVLKEVEIENLNYVENWKQIVNILTVFNVEMTLKQESEGQRFAFDFCRKMTPSLEHIHPQHLAQDNIKFETLCEWYQDKKSAIEQNSDKNAKESLQTSIDTLNTYLTVESGEKEYKEHLDECTRAIAEIDKFFDTLAKIDESSLHNISNMALVDKDTNSALGNKMIDGKRSKLYERSKLYASSNHEKGAYIMRGTWMVFNKEFTDSVANLKFWEPDDRVKYMSAIKEIYNSYVSLLSE